MTKSRGIRAPYRPWTEQELQLLRELYPDTLGQTVADRLGRDLKAVYAKAKVLGLKKSAEFLAGPMAARLDGHRHHGQRFQPGHQPWSKGTKGVAGQHENTRRTQFKKGEMGPRNLRLYIPIGGYRINSDGYLDQKVRDDGPPQGRFERVHRLVWIAANGPIPEGHVVTFRDGRRTTVLEEITVDRLECITNAEPIRRHSIHQLPPELAEVARLRGRITRAIKAREENRS